MNNFSKGLVGMALFAVVGASMAQDQVSMGGRPLRMSQIPPQRMGLNAVDMKAVKDIAIANMFEIKTSEIALSKARTAWGRQFAKEMIMEHKGAQEELKMLAQKKGAMLPSSLPADKQLILRKLQMANGSRFDQMYRQVQLDGHRETESKLRLALANGRDADVRGLETKLLPSVVMHKRMAQMRTTMMGPTKMQHNKA